MVINQVECVGRFSPAAQLMLLALLRRSDQWGHASRLVVCLTATACSYALFRLSTLPTLPQLPTANLRHQLRNAPTGNWRHRRMNTPTRNSRHRLLRNWIRRPKP
ncbi:hypothetical protein V8E54_003673 [Elaphomyces granulatus]